MTDQPRRCECYGPLQGCNAHHGQCFAFEGKPHPRDKTIERVTIKEVPYVAARIKTGGKVVKKETMLVCDVCAKGKRVRRGKLRDQS